MGKGTVFDKFKKKMLNKYTEKYMIYLDAMEVEDFCMNYHKSMEYITPKLQRTQFNSSNEEDLQITVNYIKSIADEDKGTKDNNKDSLIE